MLVKQQAFVRGTKTPRAALGQLYAQACFKRRQAAADRGWGRAQDQGRGGDAAGLDDGTEKLDIADSIHHDHPLYFRFPET